VGSNPEFSVLEFPNIIVILTVLPDLFSRRVVPTVEMIAAGDDESQ
jgi:hypothetical protein